MHFSFYYIYSFYTPLPAYTKNIILCQNFISFNIFAQISVHEQLTIARCHGVTDVSVVGTLNQQITGQQSKISHAELTQESFNASKTSFGR